MKVYINLKEAFRETVDVSLATNYGTVNFICEKCRYLHGGKSKWWRAYLRSDDGKAVPSRLFATIHEIEA